MIRRPTAAELSMRLKGGGFPGLPTPQLRAIARAAIEVLEEYERPIPMILFCANPSCGVQHIDAGEWAEKHHRTHRCTLCQHEWRPANVATVGVERLP